MNGTGERPSGSGTTVELVGSVLYCTIRIEFAALLPVNDRLVDWLQDYLGRFNEVKRLDIRKHRAVPG